MRLFLVAALLFAGAAPAIAADDNAEDKMICKRDRNSQTGSNLSKPRKTCMTAAEWRELEAESQRSIERVRERAPVDPTRNPTFGGAGPS